MPPIAARRPGWSYEAKQIFCFLCTAAFALAVGLSVVVRAGTSHRRTAASGNRRAPTRSTEPPVPEPPPTSEVERLWRQLRQQTGVDVQARLAENAWNLRDRWAAAADNTLSIPPLSSAATAAVAAALEAAAPPPTDAPAPEANGSVMATAGGQSSAYIDVAALARLRAERASAEKAADLLDEAARGMASEEERTAFQRAAVVEAMQACWREYRTYAWGADELKPRARKGHAWVVPGRNRGTGVTIVDSLSTLWLMGLKEEFEQGCKWVQEGGPDFDSGPVLGVGKGMSSHFEVTIRYVAGLLSAYELSGESRPYLLHKARDIADRLMGAYRDGPLGIPRSAVNLQTRASEDWRWSRNNAILAEFMTTQVEFRTLSYHLREPVYDVRAQWVVDVTMDKCPEDRLCNSMYNSKKGKFAAGHGTRVSVGAHGDSYFEYLLKQWLLTGGTEPQFLAWWEESAVNLLNGVAIRLPAGITLLSEGQRMTVGAKFATPRKMEHLACFAGGMYALGAMFLPDSPNVRAYQEAAAALTDTCRIMYAGNPTGLGPEVASFLTNGSMQSQHAFYLLRPEYVESLFLMWRSTGDPKYREWGWEAFIAMARHCRVGATGGFSGVRDVRKVPTTIDDVQQSFFMAETLKYLYLLFSDDSIAPLDRWLLNTEAHPLRVRKRKARDLWPPEVLEKLEQQKRLSPEERADLYGAGKAWVNAADKR